MANNIWAQEDLVKVAEALHGNSNIFVVGRNLGVLKDDDYDGDLFYDAVCKAGDVFKCEECNTWKGRDELAGGRDDCCTECDDDDDEDGDD